jgi:hypothetical protein
MQQRIMRRTRKSHKLSIQYQKEDNMTNVSSNACPNIDDNDANRDNI